MEPWDTPALTGYSCEDFASKITWSHLLLRKKEIRPNKYLTWNSIRLKFVKKIGMLNSVKSLGYITCHSSSSPGPVKNPSNFIRYICEKICSWSRRPKTILEIRKKATFHLVINNPIIYKLVKDFPNHRKKTKRPAVFSCGPFPNILKYWDHWWNLPTIWKTRLLKALIEEFS